MGGNGGKEGMAFAERMEEMNITRKEDVKKNTLKSKTQLNCLWKTEVNL